MLLSSGVPRDIKNYFRGSSTEKRKVGNTDLDLCYHGNESFVTNAQLHLNCTFQSHKFLMTYYFLNRLLYGLGPSSFAFFFFFGTKFLIARYTPHAWRMRARPKKL
jgi:hypothetical protein